MNTPLQNGLGHIFGPGKSVATDGMFPVWLEQDGSRIMGGIIDLQATFVSGLKVVDLYPSGIRTATPCHKLAVGSYIPIPTFKVVEAVTAESTVVKLAKWDGLAQIKNGMSLALPSDPSKKITTSSSNLKVSADGNYDLTITAGTFGALAVGDSLILEAAAAWSVEGLTKSNLEYAGADPTSKLNITLVDRGRLLAGPAPALPAEMKDKLQTIKYEEA
jgi:hypothetical protein